MATDIKIGKRIKFETFSGPMVGTIVGQNTNKNFILQVDKRSPVKGFKITDDMRESIVNHIQAPFNNGLKSFTYWHISPKELVEEAFDSDLLPAPNGTAHEDNAAAANIAAKNWSTTLAHGEDNTGPIKNINVTIDNRAHEAEIASMKTQIKSLEEQISLPLKEIVSKQKETSTMSDKKSAIQLMKSDGEEAAYRVAGKRLSNGANTVVCKIIKGSLGPEHGAAVEAIMKTQAGKMLTELALGWGLTMAGNNMGGIASDPRLQKLASEFRIQGTADGLDMVVGGLMQHLSPVLNEALAMLPGNESSTNARIAADTTVTTSLENEEVSDLSDVLADGKRAAAGK